MTLTDTYMAGQNGHFVKSFSFFRGDNQSILSNTDKINKSFEKLAEKSGK